MWTLKKLLGIVVLGLLLSENVEASMKYLFKTKIKCRYNYVTMGTLSNPYEFVEKFARMEFIAFDNKNLWIYWDDINQDFKGKYNVEFFGKDKIIARVSPNKTISGSIGSIIFACFLVYELTVYDNKYVNKNTITFDVNNVRNPQIKKIVRSVDNYFSELYFYLSKNWFF